MVVTPAHQAHPLTQNMVKIGEGKYRLVFKKGTRALKIMKDRVMKNYGPISICFPTELYVKYSFGISDFNKFEKRVYDEFIQKVPNEFKNRFVEIYSTGKFNGKSFSLSELIVNDDGNLSLPLSQNSGIKCFDFWKRIRELEEILIEEHIPLVDLHGKNILVRKKEGKQIPVLIDFKIYGRITCPGQPWLRSEKKLAEKIHRKIQRLRNDYLTC